MNILLCLKIFENSGVGTHVCELALKLKEMGNNVTIASSTNKHSDFLKENDIPFYHLNLSMNPLKFIKNIFTLKKIIRINNIEVVDCQHRTAALYMHFLKARVKPPYVWTNHLNNIPSDFIHRIFTFYGDQAVCVSTELKDFCLSKLRIPSNKISVIFNGVEPSNYTFQQSFVTDYKINHKITDNKKVIMLFARMAPQKGHSDLINAIEKLSIEDKNKVHVVFTGGTEGEYVQNLKKKIDNLQLTDKFSFIGYIKPSEAISLGDIIVLPSINEGFGITAIESFLMKKPFLRTKTGGYLDMKDCCISVDIGDCDGMARELHNFLNGQDYSEMIETAYNFAINECTIEVMTRKKYDLYQKVIFEKKNK